MAGAAILETIAMPNKKPPEDSPRDRIAELEAQLAAETKKRTAVEARERENVQQLNSVRQQLASCNEAHQQLHREHQNTLTTLENQSGQIGTLEEANAEAARQNAILHQDWLAAVGEVRMLSNENDDLKKSVSELKFALFLGGAAVVGGLLASSSEDEYA